MLENSPASLRIVFCVMWIVESALGNESVTYDNKMKAQLEYFIHWKS